MVLAQIDQIDQPLRLALGCEFELRAASSTSAVLQVAPHGEQKPLVAGEWWDATSPHHLYYDRYANRCQRFALPPGASHVSYRAEVTTSGAADEVALDARETPIDAMPDELLRWVMPSRFCESDELGSEAWRLFGSYEPGWVRVQAVCDFVNGHLEFVHGSSNPWTTATDAYRSQQGVCRDFAHLALTFCRALNIPARYVFGYIPDIGVDPPFEEMDFSAWFEVCLSGRWYTFDARINRPRIGRVLVGRGRDAVDVAMITSFGAVELVGFRVTAEPIV